MFKTKQVNLKLHPLTKRIVEFKQMLEEMAELDEKMAPKVQHLITSTPEIVPEIKSTKKKSSKKKLKILDKVKEKTSKETVEKDGKTLIRIIFYNFVSNTLLSKEMLLLLPYYFCLCF